MKCKWILLFSSHAHCHTDQGDRRHCSMLFSHLCSVIRP
uniref:Uncharacterized protein n=1 Tax=Anguilla anguilla TaxID=7936 RepID=A0A0E9T553_ANGAN